MEAYYDGISVVPALAPSAETAGSITALLELARHLQAHPPGRTIVLAATAAHFQAQRGIIDFLDRHARTHDYYSRRMEHALEPKLFISLDLSSGTDQLGMWNNTSSYELKRFFVPFARKLTAYAAQVASQQGRQAERAQIRDLDGESLTPVDFQVSNTRLAGRDAQIEMGVVDEEASLEFRASVHLSPEDLLIVPYGILQEAGGTLRSVAVKFGQGSGGKILTEEFLLHLSLTLFAGLRSAAEEAIQVFSYTSIGMTSVEGLVVLLVPMFITAMILLNVMMGAVYERFGEIGIYSSVGLTPLHIALLFIAEACVYAVVGTTLGYILGQGLGKLLLSLDLLEGMNLNYSSMSAMLSSLLVMLVVLLSTAYPAWMAARTAVPDIVRRWTPPPPQGDRWEFEFPFMVSEAETLGLCGFLANYFNAYSEESVALQGSVERFWG